MILLSPHCLQLTEWIMRKITWVSPTGWTRDEKLRPRNKPQEMNRLVEPAMGTHDNIDDNDNDSDNDNDNVYNIMGTHDNIDDNQMTIYEFHLVVFCRHMTCTIALVHVQYH